MQKKRTGKKRGPYKTNNASKRHDNLDYFLSVYSNSEVLDEGKLILLPCGAGQIHEIYKDHVLYVAIGQTPRIWNKCFAFEESQLLSPVKTEQAKFTTY